MALTHLSFDATFYITERPDVLTAYINGGSEAGTGMSWAQFAEQHYNDFGWKEGYNPNAIFDTSEYLAANLDVLNAGVNPFQHYLQFGAYEKRAPSDSFISFEDFDWETYLAANSDLTDAGIETAEAAYGHYVVYGQFEVRDGKPDVSIPGETFTLTSGLDKYTGTANDDVFEGYIGHLNGFDHLQGGTGNDVLNLHGQLEVTKLTTQKVEGIETINIIGTGDNAVDASGFKGAKEVWQIGRAGNTTGVAEGVTAGFRGIGDIEGTDHIQVTAAADATSLSIALDGVGAATNGEFAVAANGDKVTTLNLSGSFKGDGKLVVAGLGDKVDTINLAMNSNTDFGVYDPAVESLAKQIKTIDGSKSTGDLTVELGNYNDPDDAQPIPFEMVLKTVSLGSGNDYFRAAGNFSKAEEVSVDAGAGADTIHIDLTPNAKNAVSLTGGEGADTFIFTAGNYKYDEDEEMLLNSVSVTDFGNGADTLKLEGFKGFSAQDFVNIAVGKLDADATLADAVSAVAKVANQNAEGFTGWAKFDFDGNTYVYGDDGSTDLDEGDMLIEFVGGALLTADNVAAIA